MSNEAVAGFTEKLNEDADLREALRSRFDDLSSVPEDELIAFAGEQGYDFTVEEAKDELSDQALEGVTGGVLGHDAYLRKRPGRSKFQLGYDLDAGSFNFFKVEING